MFLSSVLNPIIIFRYPLVSNSSILFPAGKGKIIGGEYAAILPDCFISLLSSHVLFSEAR